MASSSNQTLPSPSVEENNSAELELNDLDFADLLSLFNKASFPEFHEKIETDPGFIRLTQDLHRSTPTSRIRDFTGALEKFAECVAQMEKDPDLKPIIAEIDDTGPAAFLKFWDDKYVLKKLSKARCTATLDDVEEGPGLESVSNEDEEVANGRNVLKIICEHAYMKIVKVLRDARAKRIDKKNKKKKKTTSHHASNLHDMEESDAITLQNMDSEALIDVDSETPIDDVA